MKPNAAKRAPMIPFPVMMILGVIAVVLTALLIWALETTFHAAPLAAGDDGIGNYLALIGVSFSVTFLTTSLFGGLSDKSEKIYWLSYPESYLINIPLNFMVLSSLSFLCLGIQAVVTALVTLPEPFREALFLAAFVIGIAAIVILSYKFTAVFFSRKKLVLRAEQRFGELVRTAADDPGSAKELQDAIIGLFNNTLEAAGVDGSDLARVSENIRLLLRYPEDQTCAFWLQKLILEIGKANPAMLIQLAALFEASPEGGGFTLLLEQALNRKSLPFDGSEILSFLYEIRFRELRRQAGDDGFFHDPDPEPAQEAARARAAEELNLLLRRIDTSSFDNCFFVLENLSGLPFDLLKMDSCIETVTVVWGDIVGQLGACVRERDTNAYQKLQGPLFAFLRKHPADYYDDTWGEVQHVSDQLGEVLNGKAASCVAELTRGHHEQLSYMIDVIDKEEEKSCFVLWLTGQMAKGRLPEELWDTGKYAGYRSGRTVEYAVYMTDQIIRELREKAKALEEEYRRRTREGRDKYTDNIPLDQYTDHIHCYAKLLARGKKYEKNTHTSSLRRFIAAVIARSCEGEENTYLYTPLLWAEEAGESEVTINAYAILFEVLFREKAGLEDLRDAMTVRSFYVGVVDNYFAEEPERSQKRSELLFFLGRLNAAVRKETLPERELALCAELMARVLSNPCMAPLGGDDAEIPTAVRESLALIRGDPAARSAVEGFLEEALPSQDDEYCYTDLEDIYINAASLEDDGEAEAAAAVRKAGEDYEAALRALKERLA